MSLSIFAVKNVYHKNGTLIFTKEFGGLQKFLIKPSAKKDMMQSEFSVESLATSFITSDSRFFTDGL